MKLGKIEWIILFATIVLILLGFIIFVSPKILNCFFNICSLEESSMLGEYFGGVVGSFWALAGVFLFFLALRLQSKEIKNQIEAYQRQTEQFKIQNKNIELQRIESTYFNLLHQYFNKIENLKFESSGGLPHIGYDALFHANDSLINRIKEGMEKYKGDTIQTRIKNLFYEGALFNKSNIRIEFEQILKRFRVLYKFVENIEYPDIEDKKFEYYEIFISSVTNYEIIFLFIFGMMDENKDLKDVIEKYGLFKDINNTLLKFYQEHELLKIPNIKDFYNESAYKIS